MSENSSDAVLILAHDVHTTFTKTSEHLRAAAAELGHVALLRDTSQTRLLITIADEQNDKPAAQQALAKAWKIYENIVTEHGVTHVLSLDLQWYLAPHLFLEWPAVRQVSSIWYDDLLSYLKDPLNKFSGGTESLHRAIRHPKTLHCFYGKNQLPEADLLDFPRPRLSYLAAPSDFLTLRESCEITDRAAFIGGPGNAGPPLPQITRALQAGAELDDLRRLNRDLMLVSSDARLVEIYAAHADLKSLLHLTWEMKLAQPQAGATSLLRAAGLLYPDAWQTLGRSGFLLVATASIKMIQCYDRPALVHRLFRAGLVDVYGEVSHWAPYGVTARGTVTYDNLATFYQRYSVHLNGYNSSREATANEKLFEIAACARVSVNLATPDVLACYDETEIGLGHTLAEVEAITRDLLRDSARALSMGKRARLRTARQHLWRHRLRDIFASS